VPAVADLVERFDFLPRWRVDDVMISLAAPRGSVGPHVDGYDVFLLQGRGRRRWRIARRFDPRWRPGLDLRVLRRFAPEQEWVLGPGDMLYLPPGVAHHGVALEECLTYSIGFRAPAEADLLAGFLHRLVAGADRSRLYADPDLEPAREPGEISSVAVARMRAIVTRGSTVRADDFDRFAGEHLTARGDEATAFAHPARPGELDRALRAGAGLVRNPASRIAFLRARDEVLLFADGRTFPLDARLAPLARALTRARSVPADALRPFLRRPAAVSLMAALLRAGVFRLDRAKAPRASGRGRARSRKERGRSRTSARR
jgi:50S ribosomal protein L16 3-hydroxylase